MSDTNPLLATPTDEQRRLLELVWEAFREHGQWPIYQYVEGCLAADGLDALAILGSFPMVGRTGTQPHYQAVWFASQGGAPPRPDSHVALTVAGLRHVPDGHDVIDTFLKVLHFLADRLRTTSFSATELVEPVATKDEVAEVDHLLADDDALLQIRRLLEHECSLVHPKDSVDSWQIPLRPELRRFGGVQDSTDYLNRVQAWLTPDAPPPVPRYTSPLALPESLGYLDAIWQLRFSTPLVKLPSPDRTARLAVDVGSVEEFQAAMSALAEVIDGFAVQSPGKLGEHLKEQLADPHADRIDHAADVLRAIKVIRNGVQHTDATQRAIKRLSELGIQYPITDWPSAWNQIRAHAKQAFDAIRDEIHAAQ